MSKRDYYETLGVAKNADAKTLKSAFRKKAMECHPDRHPDDPEAEARFKECPHRRRLRTLRRHWR